MVFSFKLPFFKKSGRMANVIAQLINDFNLLNNQTYKLFFKQKSYIFTVNARIVVRPFFMHVLHT